MASPSCRYKLSADYTSSEKRSRRIAAMPKTPDITLWFLQASRAIRIAWLLEELDLPYTLISSQRAPNGLAPAEFQEKIPNPLGKSPTIKDGELVVTESGAIVEYVPPRAAPCHAFDPRAFHDA